jgi:lipopolysaccharide transport system permease protein
MIHFVLAIPVIVIFLLLSGKAPGLLWVAGIPMLIAIEFLLVYGVCLILASLNLFFRDLERLTVIFMTILFYVTPIFYSETMVPARFQSILRLNPLAPLMISWRSLLME